MVEERRSRYVLKYWEVAST